MPTELGTLLRQWRQAAGRSPDQLAKEADVHPSTLRRWEQGVVEPRLDELQRVLKALGLSPQQQLHAFCLLSTPQATARLKQEDQETPLSNEVFAQCRPHPGLLLKALRRRAHLTGEQAAKKLGISPSVLSKWETSTTVLPPAHQDSVFALYQAQPEECQVLAQERWRLSPHGYAPLLPLEVCEEEFARLQQQVRADVAILGDLRFLQLEAALWPIALKRPSVQRLLSLVYGWHAEWLLRRGRLSEMGHFATCAQELMPKEGTPNGDWLCGVGIMIKAAFEASGTLKPKTAIELWESWLPRAKEARFETHAYRDMAQYTGAAGNFYEALDLIELAHQTAKRDGDLWSMFAANKIKVRLLIEAGRPQEALPLLAIPEGIDDSPMQQVYTDCYFADVLLALASRAEAAEHLAHAYSLIDSYDLAHLRFEVDRRAGKL